MPFVKYSVRVCRDACSLLPSHNLNVYALFVCPFLTTVKLACDLSSSPAASPSPLSVLLSVAQREAQAPGTRDE